MSEQTRVPGTGIDLGELPPNQGITIGAAEAGDVKDGDVVYLMIKRPNQVRAVNQAFKIAKVVIPGKKPGESKIGYNLVPVEESPEEDKERKREIAKAIVARHRDEIMEQAVAATEEALTRKPIEKLEKMKVQSDKPEVKAKVGTRRGCMFLTLGDEETLL